MKIEVLCAEILFLPELLTQNENGKNQNYFPINLLSML